MTTRTLLTTALSLFVTLSAVTEASAAGDNEFTVASEAKRDKGELLELSDDFVKIAFPGLAGYKVIYTGSHNRSWIDLEYDGETTNLNGSLAEACPGIMSNKANDVVQWRGIRTNGKLTPYAVIVRMRSSAEHSEKNMETLVVIKLDGAKSKVVGSVASNKGGNEAAEALADKLCGPK